MSSTNQGLDRKGLLLIGSVMGRSRRFVGENNKEVISYRISDGVITYHVTHWQPDSYYALGQEVCLPVLVKPYQRNSSLFVSYTIKQDNPVGEEF